MDNQQKQVVVPTVDLLTILGTLQLASSRGAFKPEEFVQIGTAYQKLYEFLVGIGAINAEPTAQTDTPQSDGVAG